MFSSRRHDLIPKSELPSTLLIMDYVALILCRFDDVIFQIKMKEISFWFHGFLDHVKLSISIPNFLMIYSIKICEKADWGFLATLWF